MSDMQEPVIEDENDVPRAPEPANLSLAIQPAVSVALWQNHVPVLSELVFRAGDEAPGEVEISLFCDPPVIRPRTWRLGGVAAAQVRPIADLDIGLDGPFLSALTEATRAVVRVAATANGTTLAELQQDVRILAHNEWGGCAGIPDILAAFVEPNDPAIARILRATSDKLKLGLVGDFQLNNAACVVCAVLYLNEKLTVPAASIHAALRSASLTGRFQQIQINPQIIVDVAHNPHAATSLAQNLKNTPCTGKTFAVLGMLADKDIGGVIGAVNSEIDAWYLADIHHVRGAKAQDLKLFLQQLANNKSIKLHSDVAAALASACKDATKNDRIIVFGSFYTVADAMKNR